MAIHQKSKSLASRESPLSDVAYQLKVLTADEVAGVNMPKFADTLSNHGLYPIEPSSPSILQINVGKLCNQSCAHCHVDAGPDRTELMSREHLQRCLEIAVKHQIETIDITGGAPELNPNFRWFVEQCHAAGIMIMNRCNLTIIVSNPKFHDLPDFFARHNVHVISSLPHYSRRRTDGQRGEGVYDDSIKALHMLNEVGYGKEDSGLLLDLVYNPTGTFLPSGQDQLEREFKHQLAARHGIVFNNLLAITNLPISRFLEYLMDTGQYEEYMSTLIGAFNPTTVDHLMCRNTISVSWDGSIYDCDFNQMLDLKVESASAHIDDFDLESLVSRRIVVSQHCYGCTAGAGSSCGGAVV